MIIALNHLGDRIHVRDATPGVAFKCEHENCEDDVYVVRFPGDKLAFRHRTNNACIGHNTPRSHSWKIPQNFGRPNAR
jgi:hypothetical protein